MHVRDEKHAVLYNWITTTLVREVYRDVAAVAIYRLKDNKGTRIFYSKNYITGEDTRHAAEFAALLRDITMQRFSV